MKKGLILFSLLVPTLALLYFGLTRNPRDLPSALIGAPAPDFDLETLAGKQVSLAKVRGRPIVLNFWSTWCGPCLEEHRLIQEIQKAAARSDLLFYSVLYEDTADNARRFISEYGQAASILLDPNLQTAINYGVSGVPETFFIDRKGVVLYKQSGRLTPTLLLDQIKRLFPEGRK